MSWAWDSKGGKLLYILGSAIMYAVSRTLADKIIGETLQTSASHFPNAQNDLTLYYVVLLPVFLIGEFMRTIYFVVMGLLLVMGPFVFLLRMTFNQVLQSLPNISTRYSFISKMSAFTKVDVTTTFALIVDTFVVLLGGTSIAQIPILLERPSWIKDELGQPISLPEEILILSSFYPNKVSADSDDKVKLVCSNLPSNLMVSASNPNDVVPHDVLVAESKKRVDADQGGTYNYRLAKCENTNDPDHVWQ